MQGNSMEGRAVLVVGASAGIGRECAKWFAAIGARRTCGLSSMRRARRAPRSSEAGAGAVPASKGALEEMVRGRRVDHPRHRPDHFRDPDARAAGISLTEEST